MKVADAEHHPIRPSQLVGLVLWRAGVLLLGSYSFFRVARLALRYIDLPLQIEIGLGLALTGAALVLASFVTERVRDARAERELLP